MIFIILHETMIGYLRKYENKNKNEEVFSEAFPTWKCFYPVMTDACMKTTGWHNLIPDFSSLLKGTSSRSHIRLFLGIIMWSKTDHVQSLIQ